MKNEFEDFDELHGLKASEPSPACDHRVMRGARATRPVEPREHRQVVFTLATMAAVAAATLLYLLFGGGNSSHTPDERPAPHFAADDQPQHSSTIQPQEADPFENYGTTRELMASVIKARYEEVFKKEMTDEQLAKALDIMHKYLEKGLRDAISQTGASNLLGNRATPAAANPKAAINTTNVIMPLVRINFTADSGIELEGKPSSFENIGTYLKKLDPKQTANLRFVVRCEGKASPEAIAGLLQVIEESGANATSITISTAAKQE